MQKLASYISSIIMLGLLVLLTVALPISAKANKSNETKTTSRCSPQSDDNPFSNTSEEKAPGKTSISVNEEYVHDSSYNFAVQTSQLSSVFIHAHEATYVAFHGEQHCPPPNI